jgi:hypothetical protein
VAALTPPSPSNLPPLGELVVDDPFWRYPSGTPGREDVAHLHVWLTTGAEPGHLAVVTETGGAASVAESAGRIRAELTASTAATGRRHRAIVMRSRDVRPRPAVDRCVGRYIADAEFIGQLLIRQAVRPPRP